MPLDLRSSKGIEQGRHYIGSACGFGPPVFAQHFAWGTPRRPSGLGDNLPDRRRRRKVENAQPSQRENRAVLPKTKEESQRLAILSF